MTTDPIKALIDLEPELQISLKIAEAKNTAAIIPRELRTILAAIEALTPIAAGTSVGNSVLLNDIRTIADTGGRRIETAMDTCDKIVELIDMERQLGPSPSASTGKDGVVERVARAIAKVIGDDDWEKANYFINTADDTIQTTQDLYRDIARAALAAIGER